MKRTSLVNFCIMICCSALPAFAFAQTDTSKIDISMKKGKIDYEKTYSINKNISKAQLYARAVKWFKKTFPDQQKGGVVFNQEANTINGAGLFKVVTSASGNYYWLRFKADIAVTDTGCTFNAYDYYEKPIEAGISNEYSKIGYRWWDYRQGHPWSAEDKALFTGLNTKTLELMTSLETALKQ